MADPWLTDEEREQHEKDVENHPLTEQAKHIADQKEELEKEVERRQKQYEEEGGVDRVAEESHGQPEEVHKEQSDPAVAAENAAKEDDDEKSSKRGGRNKSAAGLKPGAEKSQNDDAKTGGPSVS